MKLLIIGGYRFLGRALIEKALQAGHEVTAFTRGITWPADKSDVELVVGDRCFDVMELRAGRWDAVVDTCGYHPATVQLSAEALGAAVDRYVFVSTVSVYPWPVRACAIESDPVAVLPIGGDANADDWETYGARKALCESEIIAAFPSRHLIVRPGMIVGPHDETERFTHWLKLAARGGKITAPGAPERALQLIDVEDLAAFILDSIVAERAGIVNATGPIEPLNWQSFLQQCLIGTDSDGDLVWTDDTSLIAQGYSLGDARLPWWIPAEQNGLFEIDINRAKEWGLRCRPLIETVRRTWEWLSSAPSSMRR